MSVTHTQARSRIGWARQRRILAGIAVLAMAALPQPSLGGGLCLPLICGFTETGKKGGAPYIATKVTVEKLAELDDVIAKGVASGTIKAAGSTQRLEIQGYGIEMPKAEALLMGIVTKLRANWQFRQPKDVQIRIVGSLTRVPLAHPDGVIIVPLGMLVNAKSDDEMAWLLGHEFSHLALGHFAREAKRKAGQKHLATIASFVPLGVEMAQQKVEMVNGKAVFTKVADPQAVATGQMLMFRNEDLRQLFALANAFFSRKQEDQADVAGLDLMVAAKYDNGGVNGAIAMIAKDDTETQNFMDAFAKDFAAYSQKQAAVTGAQLIDDASNKKGGSGDIIGGLAKSLGRNAGRIALNKLKDGYSRDHRPPDKRMEGIRKYYGNVHEGKVPNYEGSTEVLDQIHALAEYKEATTAIFAATDAREIIANGGLAKDALAKLEPASRTRYAKSPVVANVEAAVNEFAKQYAAAENWYDIASGMRGPEQGAKASAQPTRRGRKPAKAPPAPAPITATVKSIYSQSMAGYDQHIMFLINQQKYARALQVVQVGTAHMTDDESFLPWLVMIYGKMRQTDKMAATLQRCINLDDEKIGRRCQKALMETMFAPGVYDSLSPADKATVDRQYTLVENSARSGDVWQKIANSVRGNEDDDEKDGVVKNQK